MNETMNKIDRFVTFTDIGGMITFTKCLKYLTLKKAKLNLGDFDYYISFDNKEIEVSKNTYEEILFIASFRS
jgi:hypothetical protein